MQALGSQALMAAYHERIKASHDYNVTVEILTMEETPVSPAQLVDGQINILRDADVRRTANLTLLDPDRSLELDADTPLTGALFADRMVRIRHYVDVPSFGTVAATSFVGPITKLNRNGATIDIECQDKTGLAILGSKPYTIAKGALVTDAIRNILTARTGERHFRFPTGYRVRTTRAHSVGWPDEASPWAVCSMIAHAAGLQLLYSGDGYATLRPRPTAVAFEFGDANLTSPVAGDNDFAGAVNYGRATAGDKIVKVAQAPADHPLAPGRLGRNGVPRYLPSLAELTEPDKPSRPGSKHRKASKAQLKKFAHEMEKYDAEVTTTTALAQRTANALLAAGLPTSTNLTWSAVPAFHLDVDDPVRLTTEGGTLVLPFAEASIPLVSGDMSGGLVRRVSRPPRLHR